MALDHKMPQFPHHCDSCRFLGRGKFQGQEVDAYICERSRFLGCRTLLLRFGSEDPEYVSGSLFGTVELSQVDRFALKNCVTLNKAEQGALLDVLLRMDKAKWDHNKNEWADVPVSTNDCLGTSDWYKLFQE